MRSGFVAVVGRPNVGKSTLVNAIVGAKVAITSQRPQTTRNKIRGVLHGDGFQIVFVDTPGLHKPRRVLGERLNRLVQSSLADADAAVVVVDARAGVGRGDGMAARWVGESGVTSVVAANKADVASKPQMVTALAAAAEWDCDAYFPVSAIRGEGLQPLVDHLESLLPAGPAYYPADSTTDQPEKLLIGELIREKFLCRLRDELPHSLLVSVEEVEERDGLLHVGALVLVERESQKGIVIGEGAALLQAAGAAARKELESRFGIRVFLGLRVKVEKDWQDRAAALDRFGW